MEPSQPEDLTRTVVRGASLASGGLVLTQLINLVTYVILARLALPATFGTFAAASILVTVSELVSESGLTAALIHRRERLEDALSTAFVAALVSGVFFTLLSAALSPVVGLFFRSHEVMLLALGLSAVHLLHSASIVPEALLARQFSFVRRLVVDPSAMAAFGVVSAVGVAAGLGPWGLLLGTYAYGFVRIVLSWAFVSWRPTMRRASFATWRELAGYGRHVLAAGLLQESKPAVLTLIIGRSISAGALGQFRFGSRIATSATAPVLSASAYVLFPAFARIAADEARYAAAFLRALRLLAFFVLPLSLVLAALGEPLTVLLLGERWRTAGHVLMALCALGASAGFLSISSDVMKSSGRPEILTKTNVIWTVSTIVLAFALLPFGVVAIAAGVSVSAALTAGYALEHARRVVGIGRRATLKAVWPPTVAAIVMTAIVTVVEQFVVRSADASGLRGLVLLALEAVLAAALYLAVMTILARPTLAEARDSLRLALSRRRRLPAPETG